MLPGKDKEASATVRDPLEIPAWYRRNDAAEPLRAAPQPSVPGERREKSVSCMERPNWREVRPATGRGVEAEEPMTLLKWALIFFLVSIVAGILGFTGISAASADIARLLFYIFVVIFLVLLILGLTVFRV
jgi:uncharacterized membrane protein YtjA (UPF0391 family)